MKIEELEESLKNSRDEKDKLKDEIFSLQKTIELLNEKIILQDGYEDVMKEKMNLIKALETENINLGNQTSNNIETYKKNENELLNKISKLNEQIISLKKDNDTHTTNNSRIFIKHHRINKSESRARSKNFII